MARAAAFVSTFFPLAWIVIPLLSMLIIPMDWTIWIVSFPFRPWRLFLICCSLLSLWNAIVFSYLPESPKFLLATNRKDEALNVLRRIYAFNTGESKWVSCDRIRSQKIRNVFPYFHSFVVFRFVRCTQ